MEHRFFGYGSLVNAATHAYPDTRPDTLQGWRRVWVSTAGRQIAFLSAEPASGEIDGLTATVPQGDWAALDLRETGYNRQPVTTASGADVQVYAVPNGDPSLRQPILLSYLDVVVQGFVRVFGEGGAHRFFATTAGWDTTVLDDRAAPLYPRAQRLTPAERALTDTLLAKTAAQIKAP